jgi:putative membrane-bound dehydrogenase-like protein
MKIPSAPVFSVLLSLTFATAHEAASAAEAPPAASKAVVALFDGRSLAGWEGDPKIWRIQEGVITGGSLTEMVKRNEFLATTKEYGNFIVRLKIKLTGTEGFLNSGFQIRSQRVPGDSEMAGYQCDFGDPTWWGCIYDESRRNKLMAQSDMKTLEPVLKRNDWNDYVIRAEGARITTWINGVLGVDYTEADPAIVQSGRMGIQVHGGGKALVQVKDISIEELPPTPQRKGASAPSKPAKSSPLAPADEHAAFSLAPGLEMELVVEESLEKGYGKFVAVQFDQRGRLWTMTAREYPVDANENPAAADALYASKAQDRILVYDIENRGESGPVRYAKEPTVFADGLAIPLGLLPYKGGCYTQHGHDIVFLSDTDGDGRADKREVILTGFGVQDSHLFPHQFTRAPGGWIWMAQGAFNYSKVVGPEGKITPFDQTRMCKFRPDGAGFTITSNGPCNIWGLARNGEGETFIQEANDFGYPVMPFHEYANYSGCSNSQWKSYAPEFPNLAEFRMGGTGLSGLALTDAAGSFPAEWSDVMLVANPITNRIQAIRMHRHGDGWRLELLPDVVASGDEWFRPVGMTLGPDGAVYIVDWYNKIISHNEVARNHPDRDKKRGRIWRLKGREQKGFPVPDFTKLTEAQLTAKLGSVSAGQSQLALQALEDKAALAPATIAALNHIVLGGVAPEEPGPYPAAARIQAFWALQMGGGDPSAAVQALAKSPNRNARREAASFSLFAALQLITDPDFEVRIASINFLGSALADAPSPDGKLFAELLPFMLGAAGPALAEPARPSSQSGKPIKDGVAYQREYQRYLVRMFLESHAGPVAAFLDSDAAGKLEPESLMVACLSLPARASAPRVARLLTKLGRAPNDEEILRLAEAPEDPAVQEALAALVGKAEGLQALLRQKAKFDARGLMPILTDAASKLLFVNQPLALKTISGFRLVSLEPAVAALPLDTAVIGTLKDLGSTRAALFLPLLKSHDAALRDAAFAALASTPDRLLPLWPEMNAMQRRRSLDALASTTPAAKALVAALLDGRIAKDELEGPLVDRLQALLQDDAGLKSLMDSMENLFARILDLNGSGEAFVASNLKLEGPFTVESWVKFSPGINNEDSLLGAPGVLDINFFDAHLRVWAGGGLNDIVVAKKAIIPDAWVHVAVTRDAQGNFQLYLNGEPDAAGAKADPRSYEGLHIARSTVPRSTKGQFAEYRIWNTCRSASEIRAAFDRTGLGAAESSGARPVFYRPLDAVWDQLQAGAQMRRSMDFPTLITPGAAKALDAKFDHYRALAEKPGDPARGKLLGAVCMACHLVGNQGGQIGPNLSSAGAMGTESLLRNILTPNAAMEPGYRVFRVELTDGTLSEGFLAAQDDTAIVMRLPGIEDQRIPKDQIRRSGYTKRSLMPEGLEMSFSPEQWTDLFAWLKSLK